MEVFAILFEEHLYKVQKGCGSKMLTGFGFFKSYVDNIIVFNLTLGRHMHHL